jgi:hypothetical protein
MASTYFIDNTTPIVSAWLNDVNSVVYGTSPIAIRNRGTVIATAGQTVFTVPFAYTVGAKTLSVYINGIRQILGTSYTETNPTTVTFSSAVPVTAVVEFVLG